MKPVKIFAVASALCLIAACGGGGGSGPTPTPTTPAEQAASVAAIEVGQQAAGEGALDGFSQFLPDMDAMALKAKIAGQTKATETKNINLSDQPCTRDDPESGTYSVTGTLTGSCSIALPSISCTATNSSMSITFNGCSKTIEIGGTQYRIAIDGPATAAITGTIIGTLEGDEFTPTSTDFNGTLAGTVDVSGDAEGTVDLTGVSFAGTGAGVPEITCSGTCTISLTGQEEAVCEVTTECDGCAE